MMPDQIACVACHKAKAKCRRSPAAPIGHPCTRCEAYDMQCVARISLRQKRRIPELEAAAAMAAAPSVSPPPPSSQCNRCEQFEELKAQNHDLMGRMAGLQQRVAELERENEALKTVLAPPDDGLDLPVTPLALPDREDGGARGREPVQPRHGRVPHTRGRYVL